jgi:hypothetical protein
MAPALETDLAAGRLRISYQLDTVARGGTRFRRDLNGPGLRPNVVAVMDAQPTAGSPG